MRISANLLVIRNNNIHIVWSVNGRFTLCGKYTRGFHKKYCPRWLKFSSKRDNKKTLCLDCKRVLLSMKNLDSEIIKAACNTGFKL